MVKCDDVLATVKGIGEENDTMHDLKYTGQ